MPISAIFLKRTEAKERQEILCSELSEILKRIDNIPSHHCG